METSFDVRIWETDVYRGKTTTTYWVQWRVDTHRCKRPFKRVALAESFKAQLVSAAAKGEAFDVESGEPVSMLRIGRRMSWYELACAFVDMKWPDVAATTRRTHAEAMTAVTCAMLTNDRGRPDGRVLRKALCGWGFNTVRREADDCPDEIRQALKWVARNTQQVTALGDPQKLRGVLNGLARKLDGGPAAPSVVSRRRRILNTAVEYAVEREALKSNPIPALKWQAPRTVHAVDRRVVVNPKQARQLLDAVRQQRRSGPRLVAFFGCLYYAALRPEEAVSLCKRNLCLPERGWGELHLERAEPYAGKEWTDSGENRDMRPLKQRARGETRRVPCCPDLTALLRRHLEEYGTADDGRVFFGERNSAEIPKLTVVRAWKRARSAVFTEETVASPLGRTPYDLRHACVSTWLNAGVPATQVAAWAGHSVEILLKIYAKCLDGGEDGYLRRIDDALDQ